MASSQAEIERQEIRPAFIEIFGKAGGVAKLSKSSEQRHNSALTPRSFHRFRGTPGPRSVDRMKGVPYRGRSGVTPFSEVRFTAKALIVYSPSVGGSRTEIPWLKLKAGAPCSSRVPRAHTHDPLPI